MAWEEVKKNIVLFLLITMCWGTRGAKIEMFTKLLVTLLYANSVSGFKRTNIKFNANTRGYEDIVIVVSEELSAASCPQILDNVKVCTDHFSILGPISLGHFFYLELSESSSRFMVQFNQS